MVFSRLLILAAWPSLLSLAALIPTRLPGPKPASPADPLHVWAGSPDPVSLDQWINHRLEAQQQAIQELLAVKGTHTVANTLAPYDQANAAL
ncbi:MAG: hypothetical protein ABI164_00135, partial [Acidobacteriaceae bacterium]